MKSAPTYVLQRESGYYFRYRIPTDLKPLINKSELKYSLHTRSVTIAKSIARTMAGHTQMIVRYLRNNRNDAQNMKGDTLNRLIDKHIRASLDEDRMNNPVNTTGVFNAFQRPDYQPHSSVTPSHIIPTQGKIEPVIVENTISNDNQEDLGITLTGLINRFMNEPDRDTQWTKKTRHEIDASLNILVDVLGDIAVQSINRQVMTNYKDVIKQLPPNRNKLKQYRNKSIKQLLELDIRKTISIHTINKYIGRASQLFEYAVIHGHMEKNPATGMELKQPVRKDEERSKFDHEDLKRLFGTDIYRDGDYTRSYQYWAPILALFTGARLNEIGQLHIEDFKEINGIWCIDINDEGAEHKKLKNKASKRLIPLHPFLVEDLGIIRYVDTLKSKKQRQFFPEIVPKRDGYGVPIGRWFNQRYKENQCGIKSARKTFHSFRHTFASTLSHNGIDDHILKGLMGHSEKGITYSTYVKRFPVEKVYQALIKHLDYGINLDHLKKS